MIYFNFISMDILNHFYYLLFFLFKIAYVASFLINKLINSLCSILVVGLYRHYEARNHCVHTPHVVLVADIFNIIIGCRRNPIARETARNQNGSWILNRAKSEKNKEKKTDRMRHAKSPTARKMFSLDPQLHSPVLLAIIIHYSDSIP